MRAALYARISTKEGRQHLENQLAALREFSGRMKWTVIEEFTDEESGAKPKRPGLERMMHAAAKRRFDLVAVFDLSRLTRGGPMQAFAYIARLSAARVEFWSITEEHFRTSGPAGEMFIAIAAHLAAAERSTMQNRIKAGLARARRNGKPVGRPAVIIDMERVHRLKEEGLSIRQIARKLKTSASTIARKLI
jgi:DNA invertase Pin-like site-specific DNA recombinase